VIATSRVRLSVAACVAAAAVTLSASQAANEEVARRQFDNGRANAKQGKYKEALTDFRAVAETHATTSVADNALLEIARYYLDVAGDTKEAQTAVEAILKRYATSDSAPDAHLLNGRLALAQGHRPADLDAALADFDRVLALFPTSEAVPRALVLSGQTLMYAGRLEEALSNLSRVQVEYSSSESAADAYVVAGRVLVAQGDPILAMEEMQQARNRWPNAPAAATALSRISLLHRLFVRAKAGPAYTLANETVGPARIEGVVAMAVTPKNAVYWAADTGVGIVAPPGADKPPAAQKPKTIITDTTGQLYVVDNNQLRGGVGPPIELVKPRTEGAPQPLEGVEGVAQLSTGEWLVSDTNTRAIHKYSRNGDYLGIWTQARVSRLIINPVDQVAGLDRDQKAVVFFDPAGKIIDRLPLKGTGYLFENAEDLAYDVFGHLYILDRESIGVFSPYPASKGAAPAAKPAPAPGAKPGTMAPTAWRLLTVFSEVADKNPAAFRKATAFAVDQSGAIFLADDRAQKIRVYR
jgi:TolA-binding protein